MKTEIKSYIRKSAKILIWALGLALLILLMNECQEKRDLKSQIERMSHTDTVYVDKPFTPQEDYKETDNPSTIVIYQPIQEYPDTVYLASKRDTIFIQAGDSDTIQLSSVFLTTYPEADKLIQMNLSERKLELTLLNTQGVTFTKKFKINTRRYQYLYSVEKELSHKKLGFFRNLHPTIGVRFMPVNLGLDANLGLRYVQNKVEYEIGFKTLYLPALNKPKFDAYIGVSYTF